VTAVTTTTSPGWYPEPGQSGNGPAMERWWDGTAWTEYTRTAPTDAAQAYPASPGDYGYGYGDQLASPGGGGGRRPSNVVIAIVAALVLIGGVVAGVLVLGKGSSSSNNAQPRDSTAPSATLPPGLQSPAPGQTTPGIPGAPQSPGDGTTAIDAYDGISLPVLSGWTGAAGTQGVGASITIGTYACPGDPTQDCVRGGAFAQPGEALQITATTAEAAAKADIAPNAAESYGTAVYGATTSHQELLSKAVTVAGKQGYLVRWKIATKSGTDGYVESLVFPSPADSSKLVVVRMGFDVGSQAPSVGVMDQIAAGIKADSSGGSTTGGTGV
jgi:hypothetical protein